MSELKIQDNTESTVNVKKDDNQIESIVEK